MKKTVKKSAVKEVVKVAKKERTPEQKAARKERRAQRKANVKNMAPIKESINNSTPSANVIPSQWAPIQTSDGLPFSKSIDNPDSLLAQLKRMEDNSKIAKEDAAAAALNKYRKPMYAGHSGHGILKLEMA